MTNLKEIPIFFSCDDNYIPFFAVSLHSLIENASKDYLYRIIVLHSNSISKENQEKIIARYANQNFNIEFSDISQTITAFSEKLHTRDYYSKSTYYRLFIPNLYPDFDKALYLDCDITVLGDISKLYFSEIGDNYLGAVTDQVVITKQEFIDYVEKRIGVENCKQYFNAGILVMNLEKMREINFEDKFIKLLTNVKFSVAQDQDYLNVLCKGRVKLLDAGWNVMPIEDKENVIDEINLIHYNLSFKPWHMDNVKYEDKFWEIAQKTDYYEQILNIKRSFSQELRDKADKQTINLLAQAKKEADEEEENARIAKIADEIIYCEVISVNKIWRLKFGKVTRADRSFE